MYKVGALFQEFKFSRTLTRAAPSDTEDPTGRLFTSTAVSPHLGAGACGRMTVLSGLAIVIVRQTQRSQDLTTK